MRVQLFRETQSAWVKSAYEALKDIVGGDFSPGYFNSREVLIAEANGLRVLDGVLGHVLASSPGADLESQACGLLEKVSEALAPSEVENRCHNLHGACALMLDALEDVTLRLLDCGALSYLVRLWTCLVLFLL